MSHSPSDESAKTQIDAIISVSNDWRGEALSDLRKVILATDPAIAEAVKWKKPSKPMGIPVWTHGGNICMADTLKNAVRLTFPKGALLEDPQKLFNTRLDSKTVRAIDFFKNVTIDAAALSALIRQAVALST